MAGGERQFMSDSREIFPGGTLLPIVPLETFFGLQQNLNLPRVFSLQTEQSNGTSSGKIFGEASQSVG